ncbi:hypothetical protein MAPG_06131 [Magnaporthiopsis poae ATCC 64411]|uniref:Uncharacterized protein n=1 Tax=Magnaporthiopsis poae (strain ATCC 64411 / 73-15) TaxID=644358 RepID=A0A0C4E178_MAGP6|nr:hypothetical protein MAPG_06131 [Magnaporthiopsis poae ATCC 64411]
MDRGLEGGNFGTGRAGALRCLVSTGLRSPNVSTLSSVSWQQLNPIRRDRLSILSRIRGLSLKDTHSFIQLYQRLWWHVYLRSTCRGGCPAGPAQRESLTASDVGLASLMDSGCTRGLADAASDLRR